MPSTQPATNDRRHRWAWARVVPLAGLGGALLVVNFIQLSSLVLRPWSRRAFRAVNRWCADTWWGACVVVSERLNGVRLVSSGDELPLAENAVVVANHQCSPDIAVIMILARHKDRLGDLKFFVKQGIKWLPGIGWGMQFLDCVFVRRDWASDADHIRRTFRDLVDGHVPMWLVSFVEGTRLTPRKLEASQDFARSQGLTPPRHVLLPRSRGFAATVAGLREHAAAVYDLTIGYADAVPTLWQFVSGGVQDIHVHARRYPVAGLPTGEDELRAWLVERFRDKDELLDHFARHGAFPA